MIGVTGDKWSGKTTFGSTIDPRNTVVFDLEDSSESYSFPYAQRFSLYGDLASQKKAKVPAIEVYRWFENKVETVEPGKFTVALIDPINDLGMGVTEYVESNPKEFGYTKAQFERSSGLMQGAISSHMKLLLGMLSKKVETVVFTAHLGLVWGDDGRPIKGKQKAKGRGVYMELASLYLWMERKADDSGKVPEKPSARVMKSRLGVVDVDANATPYDEPVVVNILPPRLEEATPNTIRKYILNPPDWKKLKKHELAPEEEVTISEAERLELEVRKAELNAEAARLNHDTKMRMLEADQRQAAALSAAGRKGADAPAVGLASVRDSEYPTPSPTADFVCEALREIGDENERNSALRELASAKQQLGISSDKWQEILSKRGVKSARELPLPLLVDLRDALNKKLVARNHPELVAQGN